MSMASDATRGEEAGHHRSNATARVTVREADGLADAQYLNRVAHHWFGWNIVDGKLPIALFDVAGWEPPEEAEADYYPSIGVIARHDPPNRDQRVPIGGALVEFVDHEECVERLSDGSFDPEELAVEENAWLAFAAVDPAWHGQGVGARLFDWRLDYARSHGAQMVFAHGWERSDGRSSRPLFESFGFEPIETIPEGYRGSRLACPDCGVWPSDDGECTCPMTIWAKDLLLGEE